MNSLALKNRLCLALAVLGVLLKFWLVWQSEIADASDDPREYVIQILRPIYGGIGYGPGTGLFGRMFYTLGVPFRLGVEAVFIFACARVSKALIAPVGESYLSLFLFLLALFNPAVAEIFFHLSSDEVWLVLTMLGAASLVLAHSGPHKPDWRQLGICGIYFGFSTITRTVFVPLLASLACQAAFNLLLILDGTPTADRKRALLGISRALAVPLLGIALIYYGTCAFYESAYGFFGTSVLDSSPYRAFYLCLQSVGEPTGERYFPIDENRRKLIAQAGPDARWLMDRVESDPSKEHGLEWYGEMDIPSGWIHFALFSASNDDPLRSFALFRSIEKEIAEAKAEGRLPVRFVLPLPDCRVRIVAGAFPDGLARAVHWITYEPPADAFAWSRFQGKFSDPEMSRALNRRTIHESPLREKIWGGLCRVYSVLFSPVTFWLWLVSLAGLLAALFLKGLGPEELSPRRSGATIVYDFVPGLSFLVCVVRCFRHAGGSALHDFPECHAPLPARLEPEGDARASPPAASGERDEFLSWHDFLSG